MADQTPPPPQYPIPAPGAPAPGPAPQNGIGTAALVMGILQFFCLGTLGSILAIIFGAIGRKKAKQGLATNGSVATAGFWLGIAGVIISVIAGILIAIFVVFAVDAAQESLDPANNAKTGLADGSYTMDPSTRIHVNDRCSFAGVAENTATGESGSSVTIVGEGSAQCGDSFGSGPNLVMFTVSGGVAQITGVS